MAIATIVPCFLAMAALETETFAMMVRPLFFVWLLFASLGAADASAIPSYSCVFTEPFVSLDSFPGGFRYATPDKAETGAVSTFTIVGDTAVLGGTLTSGKSFSVRIQNKAAGDGMSDVIRPYTGTLSGTVAGTAVQGACLKFPDGTTPRPVKNMAAGDKLNVRMKPSAKAKIINRVAPGGMVWAYPESTVKGWARVTTAVFPKGESGMVSITTGWVNARFLGLPGDR
jgi:uncharacterized membrane protein